MNSREKVVGVFDRHAEAYRKRLEDGMRKRQAAGRELVLEHLQARPGMRILDLACGPGTLTIPLARALEGKGEVVGVDLADGMLASARAALGGRNLPVRFLRMDIENLQFPLASFDACACGHGLHFLPHLGRALAGVKRVLKPRARFAASVPAPATPGTNPADDALREILDARLGATPDQPELAATRAVVGDPDRFAHAALAAGFRLAVAERVEVETTWDSAEHFVEINVNWWSNAVRLEGLSEHVRHLVLKEATEWVSRAVGDGPVSGSAAANVLRAEA